MINHGTAIKNILCHLKGTDKSRVVQIVTLSGLSFDTRYGQMIEYESFLHVRQSNNVVYFPYSSIESIGTVNNG